MSLPRLTPNCSAWPPADALKLNRSKRMHRRDLLDLRNVARAAGHVLGALDELYPAQNSELPTADCDLPLLRLSRRAMATTFELLLPYGTRNAMELGSDAFDRIDALESQLTVYRESSEVSGLNRSAAFAPVPVEDNLFDLLTLAAKLHAETDGAFDITAGAIIKAWGFFRGPRRVPSEAERAEALRACRDASCRIESRVQDSPFPPAGVGNQSRRHRQGLRSGSRRRPPPAGMGPDCGAASRRFQQRGGHRRTARRAARLANRLAAPVGAGATPGNGLACATAPWERRLPPSSTWNTTDKDWATSSTRAAAGPRPALRVQRCSRPPRPRRTRCPPLSTSKAWTSPGVTVPGARRSRR